MGACYKRKAASLLRQSIIHKQRSDQLRADAKREATIAKMLQRAAILAVNGDDKLLHISSQRLARNGMVNHAFARHAKTA